MSTPTAPVTMSPAQRAAMARQQNMNARNAVVQQSVDMTQLISTQTFYPASSATLNIPPRNVGLIKRYTVEISGTIQNTGSTTITLTDFGLANILSNVQYTDLNNYLRINTSGMHLELIASAKRRRSYGATFNTNVTNTNTGGNNLSQMLNVNPATWGVYQAPLTIAAETNATFRAVFEVPLAYSDTDLRGAIYANVINATQNLQLTINTNICTAGTADNTTAVYSGATGSAASITTCTVNVYQQYLYQLPVVQAQGGGTAVLLPQQDLATVYELKNSTFSAVTANQPFNLPYSNFRDFVSTFIVFNNNGLASGRTYGSDVITWALQSANMTNMYQIDPLLAAQRSRGHLLMDLPAGTYYFPTREKPISTTQYGNMQMVLNASTAAPGAYCLQMVEDLGLLNTLVGASSLAS